MGDGVIRTIAPVTNIDVFQSRWDLYAVDHGAERAELILAMDGLEKNICIHVPVNVIEGVYMKAVEAFPGMPFRDEAALRCKLRCAVERYGGAICGEAAVTGYGAWDVWGEAAEGAVKCIKYGFQGLWFQLGALLAESG